MRESVTVADRAERALPGRGLVSSVLRPGHPCVEEAVLLVNGMFDNDIRRSQSGTTGETIVVAVRAGTARLGRSRWLERVWRAPESVPLQVGGEVVGVPRPGVRRACYVAAIR